MHLIYLDGFEMKEHSHIIANPMVVGNSLFFSFVNVWNFDFMLILTS